MRIAIIKKDKCFPRRCSLECQKYCPVNRMGKECIIIQDKALIVEELCTGCGICTKRCPFGAIQIINLPQALKESPVFRYGKNAFELFRLPIPQKGLVVGILGANGIGKSTTLEILAGLLKLNFGGSENISKEEIIKRFRGSELQNYFKQLFDKKVKISYKPQYIDLIPEKFKGKAIELLSKAGSKKQILELAKEIGLSNDVLNRDVKHLSGGELQKTAIMACILKQADLYLFDEPASYLDVKERVRIAKIIRKLALNGKQVLVVEHDLVILDYLADLVHLLFGKSACYGIISHPLSAKKGVNVYLDGYLRDENIRFRDSPIKFEHQLAGKKQDLVLFSKWPGFSKKLGKFSLEVEPSEIHNKEIVGIVGANATGKTTFMKLLAGLIKPDTGKISQKLKISYKEQYLKPKKGITILQALSKITKDVNKQDYKLSILRPLELEQLMNHTLDSLSGGELQRVAIASCLSHKADLYLLDEPSNYLDVEQRLQAARTIQKVIKDKDAAALVIDHDMLFVNFISDRLMVFDGEPAVSGKAHQIKSVKEGMNHFLKELGITLRKDVDTRRPRVNKDGSQKDRLQKQKQQYYL